MMKWCCAVMEEMRVIREMINDLFFCGLYMAAAMNLVAAVWMLSWMLASLVLRFKVPLMEPSTGIYDVPMYIAFYT